MRDFDKFHDAVLKVSYGTRTKREAFDTVNDMHRHRRARSATSTTIVTWYRFQRKFRRNDREH